MFFEFGLIGVSASGKSKLANTLALEFDAIILSLDSQAVYKEIQIASAKPTPSQRKNILYYGLDLISVDEAFNVGQFIKEYERAKERAQKEDRILIIAGGSSFYLAAMLNGLSPSVDAASSYPPNEDIFAMMCEADSGAKINANDSYRLHKWYDIYASGEREPSVFLKNNLGEPAIKELDIFELCLEKDKLLENISSRTNAMLEAGLIAEARYLFANFNGDLKPLNSIGLKECREFLCGKYCEDELKVQINTHTAQLAKRQRTYNKKFASTHLSQDDARSVLKAYISSKQG